MQAIRLQIKEAAAQVFIAHGSHGVSVELSVPNRLEGEGGEVLHDTQADPAAAVTRIERIRP